MRSDDRDGAPATATDAIARGASVIVLRRDAVLMVERVARALEGPLELSRRPRRAGRGPRDDGAARAVGGDGAARRALSSGSAPFHPPPAGSRLSPHRLCRARRRGDCHERGDDAAQAEFVPFSAVLTRPLTPGAAGWIARAIAALAEPPLR